MKIQLGSCLLVFAAVSAFADAPASRFEAACRLGAREFKIAFVSKSGDPFEDDMTGAVTVTGSAPTPLPVKKALYYPHNVTTERGAPKSLCDKLPAFDAGSDRALLFISRDGRPGYPFLSLVLLDVANGKVLSVRESVGELKTYDLNSRYIVRKGKTGWHTRLVRESLQSDSDGAENYIEDWRVIEVHGDKILTAWRDPLARKT